jgi:hypothetical protein
MIMITVWQVYSFSLFENLLFVKIISRKWLREWEKFDRMDKESDS